MKKKIVKKRTTTKAPKQSSKVLVRFVSVSLGALFVAFIGTMAMKNAATSSVLGASTNRSLLADRGESDHGRSTILPITSGQPTPAQGQTGGSSSDTQNGTKPHSLDGYNTTLPQTHPAIKEENKGTITITGHKADGEGQSNSLKKINEILKGKHVEVGSSSANGLTIKSGEVEAETHFPLSVNASTGALLVTTPAGTKTVTVLPNQAVNNILKHNILSKTTSTTTSSGAATQTIQLTQVNNQPAFAIQGVSDKRLFGVFPISVPKTVYVSAQTGQVVQTKESFINQILNALSI